MARSSSGVLNPRPLKRRDGTFDKSTWECFVSGPRGTPWEGGIFRLYVAYGTSVSQSTSLPKQIWFDPPLMHPNVYSNGIIDLSVLNGYVFVNLNDILTCIQDMLAQPNLNIVANATMHHLYLQDRDAYNNYVRNLTMAYADSIKLPR
ncbi:SUMO-conjugating enzyme UBC9 [Trichinella zimbabwensis]|uniref:SUMO-conjugating enzyme UBC9 n=1 Tax=Trichinella zimbabwensis TaxID=268475 RepID=A0A0V1HC25_9BILA|nr:SUMO-conjugating enzyme UBC9 [Trichinella zimbabwensis]